MGAKAVLVFNQEAPSALPLLPTWRIYVWRFLPRGAIRVSTSREEYHKRIGASVSAGSKKKRSIEKIAADDRWFRVQGLEGTCTDMSLYQIYGPKYPPLA
ncbi:hypothetical protein PIB30_003910 [Stylosanthes scabra]|uniref:Uncharacterized protein n=1 Tax=Stylosanthes scabra TaxID=79078 RepID=A0ABU6U2C1_9FABA|nr:hypothetical protein [Stylosanthes scabra]